LELINPWISSQNSKLHSVHYYRSTTIRTPSDHYRETAKEPTGPAFANAALCRPPTLRSDKLLNPFVEAQTMDLNRGLSLFQIMIPPPPKFLQKQMRSLMLLPCQRAEAPPFAPRIPEPYKPDSSTSNRPSSVQPS